MSSLISKEMNKRLNQQIINELFAEHSYLAMSCRLEDMGLRILGKWFRHHADEERSHAMKILNYVQETGGSVTLDAIGKPHSKFESALAIVKAAMEHELEVTRQINELMAHAEKEKDYAARSFLQWFVDEQVEEVAVVRDLLDLMNVAGERGMLQVEARVAKMLESEG
jgi:ferritin